MTIKAVLHRLVVQPVDIEVYDDVAIKMKELGFAQAKTEETKYLHTQIDQGYVLDVGPTAFLDYVKKHDLAVPVKVGTLVTYARHSGKAVKEDPRKDDYVVILNDEDILCIHEETQNG
jgi:co-chaperonin GroES (HSP10)